MKILLSAYACHPKGVGSESSLGWNWLKEISKLNEVWVYLYRDEGQKEAVEKAIEELPYRQNIHVVAITVPKLFRSRLLYRIRYEIWQWKAYKVAKLLLEKLQIDLVHHVSIAAWWNCGHLWKLDVPFIFGPVSGAQQTPRPAYAFLRIRDRWHEIIRSALFKLSWRFWRRPRRAFRAATLVLVGNAETEKAIRGVTGASSVLLFPAVGVESVADRASEVRAAEPNNPLNLLWCGRFVPTKNFGLLLMALLALPSELRWNLRVAGDGVLADYWKRKIESVHLHARVVFLGRIEHSHMAQEYRRADVFVFPSLREGTPAVLVEAMAHRLPIIALDIHGAPVLCDHSSAILISVENQHQMVSDFRDAIVGLYNDPALRARMGEAGRRRVEQDFLWEKRGERMDQTYREVLGLCRR
jgi:glycosyltransferase involved in cell wall biosynthesis